MATVHSWQQISHIWLDFHAKWGTNVKFGVKIGPLLSFQFPTKFSHGVKYTNSVCLSKKKSHGCSAPSLSKPKCT